MDHYHDKFNHATDKDQDSDDEIIWVSKSEIKRDAEALKQFGLQLVELSSNALARIPLDQELKEAILLAKRIKREGRRRQLQFIGKLLRKRDVEPLRTALDKLQNVHQQQVALLHKLEILRDSLINGDENALSNVFVKYPHADRQYLHALVRTAQKELQSNKPAKAQRSIFQYLRKLAEEE